MVLEWCWEHTCCTCGFNLPFIPIRLCEVDPLTTSTHKQVLPVGPPAAVCMLPDDSVNETNEPLSHQFNCLARLGHYMAGTDQNQLKALNDIFVNVRS